MWGDSHFDTYSWSVLIDIMFSGGSFAMLKLVQKLHFCEYNLKKTSQKYTKTKMHMDDDCSIVPNSYQLETNHQKEWGRATGTHIQSVPSVPRGSKKEKEPVTKNNVEKDSIFVLCERKNKCNDIYTKMWMLVVSGSWHFGAPSISTLCISVRFDPRWKVK